VTVKSFSSLHPISARCSRNTLILSRRQRHSRGDLLRSSILNSGRTVDADKWDRSASKSSLTVKLPGSGGFTLSAVINDYTLRVRICAMYRFVNLTSLLCYSIKRYARSVARDIEIRASDL